MLRVKLYSPELVVFGAILSVVKLAPLLGKKTCLAPLVKDAFISWLAGVGNMQDNKPCRANEQLMLNMQVRAAIHNEIVVYVELCKAFCPGNHVSIDVSKAGSKRGISKVLMMCFGWRDIVFLEQVIMGGYAIKAP